MKGFLLTGVLLLLLIFGISQTGKPSLDKYALYKEAVKLTEDARNLSGSQNFSGAEETAIYNKALASFIELTAGLQAGDSLRYYAFLQAGYIYEEKESRDSALFCYQMAIREKKMNSNAADSLLFQPYLFAGSIHYAQNHFDSALYYYNLAAGVAEQYKNKIAEVQRLWNRLGAMQYETGNYKQALNYFELALQSLNPKDPDFDVFQQNYKINIATALLKLEMLDEAKTRFLALLSAKHYTSEICMNLGSISLSQQQPAAAISWFNKTIPGERNELLYHSKLARAFLEAGRQDSAAAHVQEAEKLFNRQQTSRNYAWGMALEVKAELAMAAGRTAAAIPVLQQAIIQYHNSFSDSSQNANPTRFSGAFSYIQLFNALAAKAGAFHSLYKETNTTEILINALSTWEAAFRLAAWVERTYTSDEARLFLGSIKHQVHSKPIDICLYLFEKTGEITYLEKAFYFDQVNKASVLTVNQEETEWKQQLQNSPELLQEEIRLKKEITRLSLRLPRIKDSATQAVIQQQLRAAEISLEKAQEKLAADPVLARFENSNTIPDVSSVQRKLDNNSVLLSYHLAKNELILFLISNKKFEFYRTDIDPLFFERISLFKKELQPAAEGQRYEGSNQAVTLYKLLIQPALPALKEYSRLVIIPDDELHLLPFEALQDEKKKFLVEQFAVQYQYSTTLFGQHTPLHGKQQALAMAPFATYTSPSGLNTLPASLEEITALKGMILTDSAATRSQFIRYCNSYPVLHLATHARVNNDTPAHSYIAFYPGKKKEDALLYAGEIANLRLDSVQLVILSACETGSGKLVRGEGLMSLSRSFAYAGCPDIITSLWKAGDQTTAYITRRLHYYMEKGFSKDKALQQAKLDLLHSNDVDPRLKAPGYWAHLIYIGNYEEDRGSRNWWWIAISIIAGTIAYKLLKRKRNVQIS